MHKKFIDNIDVLALALLFYPHGQLFQKAVVFDHDHENIQIYKIQNSIKEYRVTFDYVVIIGCGE